MLEIGSSSNSSRRNASPRLTSWCNYFSSTSFGIGTNYGCSSTIGCYNSPSSTSLDTWTNCEISSTIGWGLISTSSFEYEITMTYGTSFAIDIMVLLKKFNVVFNSSSNSLLLCSCSKILISSTIGACEASGSTLVVQVNQTCSTLSFSIYSLLKISAFFSTSFSLASCLNISKALSLMALTNMKKKMKTKK